MLLIDVVVDVLVHWLAGVLEMVVIDVLGDAVPHEGVREHLGDVGHVLLRHVLRPAVELQHPPRLGRVLGRDLQHVLLEEQQGSPGVPVGDEAVKHRLKRHQELGDDEPLLSVGTEQDLHVCAKLPILESLDRVLGIELQTKVQKDYAKF